MAFPVCFDISLSPRFCSAVFYTIYAISMRLAFKGGDRDRNAAAPSLLLQRPRIPSSTPTHFFLSASLSPQKAPKLSSLLEPGQGGRDVGGLTGGERYMAPQRRY